MGTRKRCPRIHAYPYFSGTLRVKPWDSAAYTFAQPVSFPYTLARDLGYWFIAVETAAGAVVGGKNLCGVRGLSSAN